MENGWWTTKLGSYQDITHKRLECLEGEEYGVVEMILKRPKVNIKPLNETEQTSKDNFENFQNLARNLINVPKKEIDDNKSKKELGKKK